jgi:hypothetical protein
MTAILDWLWNNPIWWVPIVGFGGIGTFIAWRFLGWRGALAVLAATGAALFYGKTRRAGYDSRVREEDRQATDALDRANKARERVRKEIEDEAKPVAPSPAASPKRVQPKPDPNDRAQRRKPRSV